jgi:hypothetical protein
MGDSIVTRLSEKPRFSSNKVKNSPADDELFKGRIPFSKSENVSKRHDSVSLSTVNGIINNSQNKAYSARYGRQRSSPLMTPTPSYAQILFTNSTNSGAKITIIDNSRQHGISGFTKRIIGDPALIDYLIQYFNANPDDRVNLRAITAKKIQSFTDILKVLPLANSLKIRERFDSSIALLAECKGSILLIAIHEILNLFHKRPEKARKDEDYWVIVILALVCCQNHIGTNEKLKALASLFAVQSKLTREVKTAIIDALSLLECDVNSQLLVRQLNHFTNQNELDQYVRNYAQEVIKNLD